MTAGALYDGYTALLHGVARVLPSVARDQMEERKRKRAYPVDDQADLDMLLTKATTKIDETKGPIDLSTKIQILTDRYEDLVAGRDYINAHESTLRSTFRQGTPRHVTDDIIAPAIRDLGKKLGEYEDLAQSRQNFASRAIARRSKIGQAGDGNCYITFVNVGLGDCTIVTSPLGRRMLIDCGSHSLSDVILDPDWDRVTDPPERAYIQNHLRSPLFLNDEDQIDLLFLTHPDVDHHNLLQDVLEPVGVKKVGIVYYGGTDDFSDYYPTSNYIMELAGTTAASLRNVVVREEETKNNQGKIVLTKTINGATLPRAGQPDQIGYEFVDPATGAVVIYYEEARGSDFKIAVLAGNVTGVWREGKFVVSDCEIKTAGEKKLDGSSPNKRSLIVLIECYGQCVLVCGDATAVTEQFAVDYFSPLLGTVQRLRMGHHGSPTSSSTAFLGALKKMDLAVASTSGAKTTKDHLPKRPIIALYPKRVTDGAIAHDIYAHDKDDAIAHPYFEGLVRKIYATGSNDSIPVTISGG
jgi:beta-lactamase superfamily II metal-dependent hydrolase